MTFTQNTKPKECIKFITSNPLKFGDADQIRAVKILALAELLLTAFIPCNECGGTGEIDADEPGECNRCGRECGHCGGTAETCHWCDGSGERSWARDEIYELSVGQICRLLGYTAGDLAA